MSPNGNTIQHHISEKLRIVSEELCSIRIVSGCVSGQKSAKQEDYLGFSQKLLLLLSVNHTGFMCLPTMLQPRTSLEPKNSSNISVIKTFLGQSFKENSIKFYIFHVKYSNYGATPNINISAIWSVTDVLYIKLHFTT